ncbi:hypothetical protein D9M68_95700 [compost metagenome]|uniref:TnsA endonuclease N-terminal domain-containing protein n=1 Tax=Pseudomonas sp. ACN8 TaxID=1920428 RepID=UPI000FA31141|nr:TnsA endonuclease N-terminal domain-containing protein [Pseudomonas sp. ACN8]PBJ18977.1 hypothetical protein BSF44_48390 [Pseudomonas sp. ACN8]
MLDKNWVPSHFSPARDVRKNRYGKSLVYFPSRKNHTQLICESHNEADMCLILEYLPAVIQYYIQPVSHTYNDGNKPYTYTPDFFIQRDERSYFIEIKGGYSDQTSSYQHTLDNFAATAGALGYGFEVFVLSDFPTDETLDNLGLLYSRSHQVTAFEQRQLMQCLSTWNGPLTISLLLAHNPSPSMRAVCAAIFQQKLNCDLTTMLNLHTPLYSEVKHEKHNPAWPSLVSLNQSLSSPNI